LRGGPAFGRFPSAGEGVAEFEPNGKAAREIKQVVAEITARVFEYREVANG